MQTFEALGWRWMEPSGPRLGGRDVRATFAMAAAGAVVILGTCASASASDATDVAPSAGGGQQMDRERRGFLFLDAEVGTAYVDVLALKYGDLLDPARAKSSGFGFTYGAAVGADYYVSRWFSIGAELSGDAFFLHRKGDRLIRSSSSDPNSPVPFPYANDGSGNGLGASLSGYSVCTTESLPSGVERLLYLDCS